MIRDEGRPPAGEDWCGTNRGWHRHNRLGEAVCHRCYRAHAWYLTDRRLAPARRAILAAALAARVDKPVDGQDGTGTSETGAVK